MPKKFYNVLGASENSTAKELRRAYKKNMVRFHPDKYKGSREQSIRMTKKFIEAYQTLGDPVLRFLYDAYGFHGPKANSYIKIRGMKNIMNEMRQKKYKFGLKSEPEKMRNISTSIYKPKPKSYTRMFIDFFGTARKPKPLPKLEKMRNVSTKIYKPKAQTMRNVSTNISKLEKEVNYLTKAKKASATTSASRKGSKQLRGVKLNINIDINQKNRKKINDILNCL